MIYSICTNWNIFRQSWGYWIYKRTLLKKNEEPSENCGPNIIQTLLELIQEFNSILLGSRVETEKGEHVQYPTSDAEPPDMLYGVLFFVLEQLITMLQQL